MGMAKAKEKEFEEVYEWVDAVALSRKRKSFARDFSDGCLTAEVIKHYAGDKFAVDLHNFSEALSGPRKRDNWNLLNDKILRKHLGIRIDKAQIEQLCSVADGAAERLLMEIKAKFDAGAAPPVRKQLLPLPVLPDNQKVDAREKGRAAKGHPQAEPRKAGRRGGHDHEQGERAGRADRVPDAASDRKGAASKEPAKHLPHHALNSAHNNSPAGRPSPHPPAERGGERKIGISPVPAGGRGQPIQRASSASKAGKLSPQRTDLPGPAGRGRESREWWGEPLSPQPRGYDAGFAGVRGSDWHGGGGLENLLELAQGDLSHFDMQLQMHLKNDLHEGKHNEQLVLPRVKNAGNFKNLPPPKSKDDGRERSLSPSKSPSKAPPKSKESPLKLLPNREPRGAVGILFRLYSGSIQALFRLYSGSIQTLFRLYSGIFAESAPESRASTSSRGA
jgi:hypothetical protein